jgi:transposase
MRLLKERGYSNRQIAEIFNVAKSTVWDNVYSDRGVKIILPPFRKIQIAIEVIKIRKEQGKNTQEVSKELDIPLGEVNYIWGTIHLKESVV